ncbi:MAG: carbohydrate-binding family 9-like protein [Limisphaerales bacterium]
MNYKPRAQVLSARNLRLSASLPVLVVSLFSASGGPVLKVPEWPGRVTVDGKLNEACYRTPPSVARFVVAGNPAQQPQATKAWLFWQPERLIFAFECEDADIVAPPPSRKEHDVDLQDRVELFLWSGRKPDAYYCLEIGALGAVHDYRARFYRRFDDAWSPATGEYAVSRSAHGYRVEGALSRAAIEAMGFHLEAGARWRVGLFRADFSSRSERSQPTWITWVDAATPQPDFHVPESFGEIVLVPARK